MILLVIAAALELSGTGFVRDQEGHRYFVQFWVLYVCTFNSLWQSCHCNFLGDRSLENHTEGEVSSVRSLEKLDNIISSGLIIAAPLKHQ